MQKKLTIQNIDKNQCFDQSPTNLWADGNYAYEPIWAIHTHYSISIFFYTDNPKDYEY